MDFKRYRPLWQIAGAMILAVLPVYFILSRTLAIPVVKKYRQNQTSWKAWKANARKLSTVKNFSGKLMVVIGASSTIGGLDPEILQKNSGYQWLVLAEPGGNIAQRERLLDMVIQNKLQNKYLLINLHNYSLIEDNLLKRRRMFDWKILHQKDVKEFYRKFLRYLRDKKNRLGNDLLILSFQIRKQVFRQFDLDPNSLFKKEKNWEKIILKVHDIKSQKKFFSEKGYFDKSKYLKANQDTRSLQQWIIKLRRYNIKPIIVIMPDHSELRNLLPDNAKNLWKITIDDSIAIIDLNDSCPDHYFNDLNHLGKKGQKFFSKLYANQVLKFIK